MTDFMCMKSGRRGKMNVGDSKVSEVQGTAIHDLLEVRLRNYRAICMHSMLILDYRE